MTATQEVPHNLSVLVVEKDVFTVGEIQDHLSHGPYRVVGVADTAQQGIEIAAQMRPDVVLLDAHLHGSMSSDEAADQFLAYLKIPIVYLILPSDIAAWIQAQDRSPFDYVLKPIQKRELLIALEVAVLRYQREESPHGNLLASEAILSGMTDAIVAADREGRVRFMNSKAEMLTGWRGSDAQGRPVGEVLKIVADTESLSTEEIITQAVQERSSVSSKYAVLSIIPEGCHVPVEYSVAAALDPAGRPVGVVVTVRDASERRQSEEALRRSETFLQMSQQAGRCGSYEWDLTTNRTTWSDEMCRIHGIEPGEGNGSLEDSVRFVHPDDLSAMLERISHPGERRWPNTLHYRIIRPDGTERRLWGRGEVITEANGQAQRIVGTVVDITDYWKAELEREIAETALRESDEFNRQIISSTQAGLVVLDTDLRYKLWNPRMEATIGLSAEAVLGKSPLEIFPSLEATEAYHQLERALMGETTTSADFSFEVPTSGRRGWLWQIAGPLRNSRNEIVGVLASVIDVTERHENQQQLQRQFDRLEAQRTIDASIIHNRDMLSILRLVLGETITLLDADAAAILLPNRESETLEYAVFEGFPGGIIPPPAVDQTNEPAAKAAQERRRVVLQELPDGGALFRQNLSEYGEIFANYYALPLIADNVVHGVIEVYTREVDPPNSDWLESLNSLAAQAAIAAQHSMLLNDLERANEEMLVSHDATISGWSRALDLRDKETEGHSERVTDLTIRLARSMGIEGDALVQVRRGALLHDVGKLGIPDNILLKSGPLTEEEWELMRMHPIYAYEMLNPITFLRSALAIPYCHHEKWDGTGYPNGLAGEQIPLAARIFALADVYDALCSDRPYRAGWPPEQVREHIRNLSGTHLDPAVVEAFLKMEV